MSTDHHYKAAGGMQAETGRGWREQVLSARIESVQFLSSAQSVAQGRSVLILDALANVDECEALLAEAETLADTVRMQNFAEKQEGCTDPETGNSVQADNSSTKAQVPLHCLRLSNASRIRMPVKSMFSYEGQRICDTVLLRALNIVETEIPELSQTLFGARLKDATTCLDNERLTFAAGEPAINVYTSGGSFVPHEDGQSLTVLVNLSHADTFEGGGTAFWSPTAESDEDEGDCDCMPFGWGLDDDCDCMPIGWGRRPPTFSLSPPVGSALLFGGSVTHSGREVVCGLRGVLVASFSLAEDT